MWQEKLSHTASLSTAIGLTICYFTVFDSGTLYAFIVSHQLTKEDIDEVA